MEIIVGSEHEILQEGEAVLIEHLGISKAARFFSLWRQGTADYLDIRKKLFEAETVDSLYDKIVAFEKQEIL